MTFAELPLYVAIYNVREMLKETGEEPGSDTWNTRRVREMYGMVMHQIIVNEWPEDQVIPWTLHQVAVAWQRHRKRQNKENCVATTMCQLAMYEKHHCFYERRIPGGCTKDVHVDRLVAGGEYSLANCVLACGHHNCSRSNRSVEEYLLSAKGDDHNATQRRDERRVGLEMRPSLDGLAQPADQWAQNDVHSPG